jgi:hypothetical protein
LNFRVAALRGFSKGRRGWCFLRFVDFSVDGINADQPVFEIRVEGKTAPGPLLGVIDQFSFQRVHMHVVEFFNSLLQTPHVKVVKPPLPKARQQIVATCKDQIQLSGGRSPFAAEAARDALFQYLNYSRRRSFDRFADEQMDVLRHDNVAHKGKSVAVAHLAKNSDESVSGANRAQKWQTSIASEGNEMRWSRP